MDKKLLPTKLQRKMREHLARHGIAIDVVVQRWTSIGELLDKLNQSFEIEKLKEIRGLGYKS